MKGELLPEAAQQLLNKSPGGAITLEMRRRLGAIGVRRSDRDYAKAQILAMATGGGRA